MRLWWILAIILLVYVGFMAALLAFAFGFAGDGADPGAPGSGPPTFPEEALPPLIYSIATAVGYVIPLILGTLSSTGEVRYQTLTPTFLAQPKRGIVLGAKLVVDAIAGAVLGLSRWSPPSERARRC